MMKKDYDFSKGQRGRFYRPDAVRHIPVYLDPDVCAELTARANREGITVEQMVNHWLRQDLAQQDAKPS